MEIGQRQPGHRHRRSAALSEDNPGEVLRAWGTGLSTGTGGVGGEKLVWQGREARREPNREDLGSFESGFWRLRNDMYMYMLLLLL